MESLPDKARSQLDPVKNLSRLRALLPESDNKISSKSTDHKKKTKMLQKKNFCCFTYFPFLDKTSSFVNKGYKKNENDKIWKAELQFLFHFEEIHSG